MDKALFLRQNKARTLYRGHEFLNSIFSETARRESFFVPSRLFTCFSTRGMILSNQRSSKFASFPPRSSTRCYIKRAIVRLKGSEVTEDRHNVYERAPIKYICCRCTSWSMRSPWDFSLFSFFFFFLDRSISYRSAKNLPASLHRLTFIP